MKIRIIAFAVMLVMLLTSFCGCVSLPAVDELGGKVNTLDEQVKEQAEVLAGIEATLKELTDAVQNQTPSTDLEEVKADIEANKQNVADIISAIEALKETLKEETTAPETEEDEELRLAISRAGALINLLKGEFEDNKNHYTAESITAIREIFSIAKTEVMLSNSVADIDATIANMNKSLEEYQKVNDSIYAYVKMLDGNITKDTLELVKEAVKALEEAKKFYEGNLKALTNYKVGEDEINLINEIEAISKAQIETLPLIEKEAKALVKRINDAEKTYDIDTIDSLYSDYRNWSRNAKKLSVENLALVTNYNKLEAIMDNATNVRKAKLTIGTVLWEFPSLFDKDNYVGIFGDYEKLTGSIVFTNVKDEVKFTTYLYKEVDTRIAEFMKEYDLSDAAFAYVAKEVLGIDMDKYEYDKAINAVLTDAYEDIQVVFNAIKALNVKNINSTNAMDIVSAYEANAKAIDDWAKAVLDAYKKDYIKNDNYNYNAFEALLTVNFNTMVELDKLCVYDAETKTYADYNLGFNTTGVNDNYGLLYDFSKNEELGIFLFDLYPMVEADAKRINEKIDAYKPLQQSSVINLLVEIGGFYTTKSGKLVECESAIDIEEDAETIADFYAKYEKYGLNGLINVAKYEALVATVEANILTMENTLNAFLDGYDAIYADDLAITTDNMDTVFALRNLLKAWRSVGVNATKLVYSGSIEGKKEYNVVSIIEDKVDLTEKMTTVDNWVATANTIKAKAEEIVKYYGLINKLNSIDKIIFEFKDLKPADVLGTYGIISVNSITTTVGFVSSTTWSVAFINDEYEIETITLTSDANRDSIVEFVKTTYEPVNVFELIIATMTAEAEFAELNNKAEYTPVIDARSGWLTEGSDYGFGFVRYATYLMLGLDIEDADTEYIADTTNYDELRSAVYAIICRNATVNKVDIAFGNLVIYECE